MTARVWIGSASRQARRAHQLRHLRIFEAQIETLHELAAHLRTHGCDEHAQQAAANLMRYFDTAGRLHYEDEERDVFPSLMTAALGLNAGRVALLKSELIPLAMLLLTEPELMAIGRSMAHRRGVPPRSSLRYVRGISVTVQKTSPSV